MPSSLSAKRELRTLFIQYSVNFPDVALTAANCAEPVGVMEQETEYLTALHAITHYAVSGNELQLTDDQGTSALAMHGDKELLRSIETGVL